MTDIATIAPHSDISPKTLTAYQNVFREAHTRAPGGLSLEVGTRSGGSALLWLELLREMYPIPPFLFTVDPYGAKVYMGTGNDYDDDRYQQMKTLLLPYPNHAHFRLTSLDFFEGVAKRPFWTKGVEQHITGFSFVFLDGDHSYGYLSGEVGRALPLMRQHGVILLDNADQPDVAKVAREYDAEFIETGAVIRP